MPGWDSVNEHLDKTGIPSTETEQQIQRLIQYTWDEAEKQFRVDL